jgi:hypothetical protein
VALALTLCGGWLTALSAQPAVLYLSYDQVKPVFDALGEPAPPPTEWFAWIASADAATRARLRQGDETSVVNLLLFGTSFTSQPRVTSALVDRAEIERTVAARVADMERALAASGSDERLEFARQVIGRDRPVKLRLREMLERVNDEMREYEKKAGELEAIGDASLQFAERSQLYRTRGLSSDTSLRPNFAVEQALEQLYAGGLAKTAVRRVAVIGPGLDFTDKQEGYDFYPVQTIQPFAIGESLIRLGVAEANALTVTTLDLNPRVNGHIQEARRRARMGGAYEINLPLEDGPPWTPEFLDYWRRFGAVLGRSTTIDAPPRVGSVRVRTVEAHPSSVQWILSADVNVAAQYLPLAESERFDLVVATNVFLYYNRLQQGLALAGLTQMMKPGAVLLSNNALVEVPSNRLRSIGYSRSRYSNREEDGDLIVWYRLSQ